jgi:hypothetical protein
MARPAASFAARVERLRKQANLGARELDRLAGLAEGHVSMLEWRQRNTGGGARTEMRTATRIAAVLGASLDYLMMGDGPAPTAEAVCAAVEAAKRRHRAA